MQHRYLAPVLHLKTPADYYPEDVGLLEYRKRNEKGKQIYEQKEVDFVARLGSREC